MSEKKPPPKSGNLLEVIAGRNLDKKAIVSPGRTLTYSELRKRARTLAKGLYRYDTQDTRR